MVVHMFLKYDAPVARDRNHALAMVLKAGKDVRATVHVSSDKYDALAMVLKVRRQCAAPQRTDSDKYDALAMALKVAADLFRQGGFAGVTSTMPLPWR